MHPFFSGDTQQPDSKTNFAMRRRLLLVIILLAMILLALRAIDLQVINKKFLQTQGDKRHISTVPVATYRGKIFDRHGEIMAISSPVQSVWVNPQEIDVTEVDKLKQMIKLLALPKSKIKILSNKNSKSRLYVLCSSNVLCRNSLKVCDSSSLSILAFHSIGSYISAASF